MSITYQCDYEGCSEESENMKGIEYTWRNSERDSQVYHYCEEHYSLVKEELRNLIKKGFPNKSLDELDPKKISITWKKY